MMLFTLAAAAIGLAPKALGAYFATVSAFALRKSQEFPDVVPTTRFAVVVAARNEAGVIGRSVESLREQTYPEALYDIYVAPNHCTDDTADIARAAGARILHCSGAVRDKGGALREALDTLLSDPASYDAFVVFDADNLADRMFLAEMDKAFQAGARAAKGRIESKNPYDSWIAGCYSIYFGIQSVFFNRARAACGLSAKLAGTGFAVARGVLEKLGGWRTGTITEDVEFSARLALAGERIWWVPQAISYDEEPTTLRVSMKQRKRWCSGILQVSRLFLRDLLQWRGRTAWPLRMDTAMLLLLPYTQVLSLLTLPIAIVAAWISGEADTARLVYGVLTGALLSFAGTASLAAGIAFGYAGHDRRILKSVLGFPLFMVSWVPLQVLALCHNTVVWEEIRHTRGLSLREMPDRANPKRGTLQRTSG